MVLSIRPGRTRKLIAAAATGALAALLAAGPQTAGASCAPWKPREMLAASHAAFVGRFVERTGDRATYLVERSVKGGLGARVQVRDENPGPVSIGNRAGTPGQRHALFLRRDATGYLANGCSAVPPAALLAAAASGRPRCLAPRVRSVFPRRGRNGRGMRLQIRVRDRDGPLSSVRVDWGDGTVTRARLKRPARRRLVTLDHVYRLRGRRKIRVIAVSRPSIDCWIRGLAPVPERSEAAVFAA